MPRRVASDGRAWPVATMAVTLKPWVCYLLECADGTLYAGITNDLTKRLAAHNAGRGARYTRGRAPVKLVYSETQADRSEALRREAQIKRLPRHGKLALARSVRRQRLSRLRQRR